MGGLAVHVGPSPSRAALRLAGVAEARRLLEALRGNGAGA
jgi:hypothetical protein